jgi:hypothetical protein
MIGAVITIKVDGKEQDVFGIFEEKNYLIIKNVCKALELQEDYSNRLDELSEVE